MTEATLERRTRVRERWLSDAIIAGFVAIGTSTAALMIAYVLANGAADSQGDVLRQWLWQLTHNEVVGFSSGRPAYALAIHVVLGIVWALLYARFIEWNRGLSWWIGRGPGWERGVRFALLPWLVSLLVLLPAAMVNMLGWALSAGPLVPLGNLVLHLIYGFTLGQLYDTSSDDAAIASDLTHDEPLQAVAVAHSEDFGAAGIVVGAIVGALVGAGLAIVLPPVLPNVDFGGWQAALAVGGILAGGAVGGIVGSFAGLPQTPPDAAELASGPDPFQYKVLPFLIPPALIVVIAAIISTLGTSLLQLGKSEFEIGPITIAKAVLAAVCGIFIIGFGALWLATRPESDQSPPSSRDTVSHRAEH
ncbi:MAG: hypothetical protein JO020_26090 [Chloroflexi bacterium]|nr:hypothetical protein [Chloroflexota bacterium]MBV9897646.1 hypothetical protein [Chloroflexota bacterium]